MWSVLASCVTMVVFGTSLAVEPSCPVCSKYEYEVRLLERVLSNEMALKNTLNKITETHAKVEDSLKAIQAENVKLNNAMHSLEVKKQELNNKVDGFIDAGIRNLTGNVEKMSTMVQSLVAQTSKELDIMKGPLVMFHARHLDGQYTYTVNQDVVFRTVLSNEGGGYDPNTGHFKAPVAGVYMFIVQFCPYTNKYANFDIAHDGKPLQRSYHYDKDDAVCVSMQAFAKVAKGGKVWVRGGIYASDIYCYESYRWCSFAGLLIRV